MKKAFNIFLAISLMLFVYYFKEDIFILYNKYLVPIEKKTTTLVKNEYYREYDFSYFKNTNNFIPKNKDDLKNIYYTVVNSGMENFTFYCPNDYQKCINDVNEIANDQNIISTINNFVNPYNSFKTLKTEIDTSGRVNIHIEKVYDNEMIILINYKIDEIYNQIIKDNLTKEEKIKKIHDYIINNTKYDILRSDDKIINYQSDNAYGVLIEKYGICSGYTDAMMLFLEKMAIENIKISTDNHVWNYVKLDDEYLHLDLTWDDPTNPNGPDILDNTYFLISDNELKSIEKIEHNYDKEIYKN